jgi:hypothetical protein
MLTDGRTLVIHAPEPVAGSPGGGPIMPPIAGDGLVLVEPDPDVDLLRSGEIPEWLRDRMSGRPEFFVKVARLEPEGPARVLGRLEG